MPQPHDQRISGRIRWRAQQDARLGLEAENLEDAFDEGARLAGAGRPADEVGDGELVRGDRGGGDLGWKSVGGSKSNAGFMRGEGPILSVIYPPSVPHSILDQRTHRQ